MFFPSPNLKKTHHTVSFLGACFKEYDVSVLNNIVFSLHANFCFFSGSYPSTKFYEIGPVYDVGFNKGLLKIGMNHSRSLWSSCSDWYGPCSHFLFSGCKIVL